MVQWTFFHLNTVNYWNYNNFAPCEEWFHNIVSLLAWLLKLYSAFVRESTSHIWSLCSANFSIVRFYCNLTFSSLSKLSASKALLCSKAAFQHWLRSAKFLQLFSLSLLLKRTKEIYLQQLLLFKSSMVCDSRLMISVYCPSPLGITTHFISSI